MRQLPIVAAALLLSVTPTLKGDIGGTSPSGKADGKQFTYSVTAEAVKATPAWTPNMPCPPLEPRRAIEIATKQLSELVKDPSKWHFHEISLVDFGDHVHWLYVAMFDKDYPADVAVFGADYFQIPVLTNGTVLKPEVKPLPPDVIKHSP